jgi:hypothetical protein
MNIKILQNAEPTNLHQIELSRWDNEGGAGPCDQQCGQQMLQKQARNILHPDPCPDGQGSHIASQIANY